MKSQTNLDATNKFDSEYSDRNTPTAQNTTQWHIDSFSAFGLFDRHACLHVARVVAGYTDAEMLVHLQVPESATEVLDNLTDKGRGKKGRKCEACPGEVDLSFSDACDGDHAKSAPKKAKRSKLYEPGYKTVSSGSEGVGGSVITCTRSTEVFLSGIVQQQESNLQYSSESILWGVALPSAGGASF